MHTYDDLTTIFEEFRDFQVEKVVDGVPDYTIAGMQAQYEGLQEFRNRLAAIDSSDRPVSRQVDYHLVRAEMNALEFFHKVHKPWARDPGFYSMIGGDAGAVMNTGDFFAPLLEYAEPVLMASFTGRDLSDLGFQLPIASNPSCNPRFTQYRNSTGKQREISQRLSTTLL